MRVCVCIKRCSSIKQTNSERKKKQQTRGFSLSKQTKYMYNVNRMK